MEITWDTYEMNRWQPTPDAVGGVPGRDLMAAGTLSIGEGGSSTEVTVSGAVPFSLPTEGAGVAGDLVFIPADEEITAANSAGKIVVRDNPPCSIPYSVFEMIGHYLTEDLPTDGEYDRPYLRAPDQVLIDAGIAGAAGVIVVWDVPTDQFTGYWDPHSGTRFRVPAVYVGNDARQELVDAARAGTTAKLQVLDEWSTVATRNLFATLPAQTRERIVVTTNTDSVTWVQENGTVTSIALARYFGSLPKKCRTRDIQFALTTNHLGFNNDGAVRYGDQLDEDYDKGTVAFVMSPEHLGTKEILPTGENRRLEYSGDAELFAWSAPPESPVLVEASVDAVKRRNLQRVAVLEGVGLPGATQPSICSRGGLGTGYHQRLVPTIAGISGAWSLWAPAFGEDAIHFERFRDTTLAFGDIAIELDDVDRTEIAGAYVEARAQSTAGNAKLRDMSLPPVEAPGP